MPKGPLGFRRLTNLGPLVKSDEEYEWDKEREEAEEELARLGL